ncbi:hypothetical protein [Haloarcula onubensis]|uniref:Uncharacterized protein n=1 Tax=Haloarcula onubensis TaxID=2950539 RepID=A0ABU2FRW7_9EURY|nr:hypothetical protein [Halomicroarcula sp. S3CR25-11]MDS0283503.1 hypothetical protein [Halomicroarcula sp. S3CR25-11]
MRLDRTAKFGTVGAAGVLLVALTTAGLSVVEWNSRITGAEGSALQTIALVVAGGIAVAVVFLFVVIGAYIDRELAARGLDSED